MRWIMIVYLDGEFFLGGINFDLHRHLCGVDQYFYRRYFDVPMAYGSHLCLLDPWSADHALGKSLSAFTH